jgi:hypothetical protein
MLKLGDYGGRVGMVIGMLIVGYDCIFTDPGPKTWIGDTYYYFTPRPLAYWGLGLILIGALCGVVFSLARQKCREK